MTNLNGMCLILGLASLHVLSERDPIMWGLCPSTDDQLVPPETDRKCVEHTPVELTALDMLRDLNNIGGMPQYGWIRLPPLKVSTRGVCLGTTSPTAPLGITTDVTMCPGTTRPHVSAGGDMKTHRVYP